MKTEPRPRVQLPLTQGIKSMLMTNLQTPPSLQVAVSAPVALHLGGAEAGQRDVRGPGLRPHHRPQRLAQAEAAPPAPAPRGPPRHRGDSRWPPGALAIPGEEDEIQTDVG